MLATALVTLALVAIVTTALVVRYSQPPRAAAAEAACVASAEHDGGFVVDDSFVVDSALTPDDDWRGIAAEIEPTMQRPAGTETSWVIGTLGHVRSICIRTYGADPLVDELQIFDAALFDSYR